VSLKGRHQFGLGSLPHHIQHDFDGRSDHGGTSDRPVLCTQLLTQFVEPADLTAKEHDRDFRPSLGMDGRTSP
jgi:hypothetical protein